MLWTRDVDVKLNTYDKLHIDISVLDPQTQEDKWRFTGFYGEARRELRYRSQECLRLLNNRLALPWLCAGDFNEVLAADEQFGGQRRPECQMEGFREVVDFFGFIDLGYIGLPYTWDNRQQGEHHIKVRLYRGFANGAFLKLFQEVKMWHLQTTESDHCALLIECTKNCQWRRKRRRKRFWYENMWERDPTYMDTVRNAWPVQEGPTTLEDGQRQLGSIKISLQSWERTTFGSVREELARLRQELEQVRGGSVGTRPSRHEHQIMSRLAELLSREECMEK